VATTKKKTNPRTPSASNRGINSVRQWHSLEQLRMQAQACLWDGSITQAQYQLILGVVNNSSRSISGQAPMQTGQRAQVAQFPQAAGQ
jgi:hypothetical protein